MNWRRASAETGQHEQSCLEAAGRRASGEQLAIFNHGTTLHYVAAKPRQAICDVQVRGCTFPFEQADSA